jgi:hypothetical protein
MTPSSTGEIETSEPSINWLSHSFKMKTQFIGSVSVDRLTLMRMIDLTT